MFLLLVMHINDASVMFDKALSFAIQRLSCPSLTLKPEQRSIIQHVFHRNDVFAWLSTGFGKPSARFFLILPYLFDAGSMATKIILQALL